MAPVDPIAALLSLADAAASGRPVPEPVAAWLVSGVRSYLNDREPLDVALGLRAPGWSPATRLAYARRNQALRAASALVDGPAQLSREITRFESRTWPRWKGLPSPPARASDLDRTLDQAFRTGAPVPASARQLSRIARAA